MRQELFDPGSRLGRYQQAYQREIEGTRTREQAEQRLIALGATQQEAALMAQAKSASDELAVVEDRAFREATQGRKREALELVFSQAYRLSQEQIHGRQWLQRP